MVFPQITAGLAKGFSSMGGLFDTGADEAQKKNEELLKFIKMLYGKPWQKAAGAGGKASIFGHLLEGYRQGLPQMQAAADTAQQGYKSALAALGGAGVQARRDIADLTRQSVSATQQGAASRGLYNTSAAMQAGNQARYQGQRASGQLGAQLGGMFSQTHLQGSSNYAQALQNLAQFYSQKGRDMLGAGSSFASALGGFQFQPGTSPFQQIAPLLGTAAGFGLGKL